MKVSVFTITARAHTRPFSCSPKALAVGKHRVLRHESLFSFREGSRGHQVFGALNLVADLFLEHARGRDGSGRHAGLSLIKASVTRARGFGVVSRS